MTPEAQQIAIAEACGLSDISKIGEQLMHGGTGIFLNVPDYLNDLNAMAEAEKVKEMAFDSDYAYWLAHIAVRDRGLNEDRLNVGDGFQIALTATAAQKAEAFLKALNLWKEASK
jgi:hypothetical protein